MALFRGAQEGNTAAVAAEVLIIRAAGESWVSAPQHPISVSSPGNASQLIVANSASTHAAPVCATVGSAPAGRRPNSSSSAGSTPACGAGRVRNVRPAREDVDVTEIDASILDRGGAVEVM